MMVTEWWVQPEWWTASGTWALVLVTAVAAGIGLWAGITAKNVFVLESEPVLVLDLLVERVDTHVWYFIDYVPGQGKGIEFRPARAGEKVWGNQGRNISIRNVGRSPAVGVTVPIRVTTESLDGSGIGKPTTYEGRGRIIANGIAPQTPYYIRVINLLGGPANLVADAWGTQLVWNDPKRVSKGEPKTRPLAVVSATYVIDSDLDKSPNP